MQFSSHFVGRSKLSKQLGQTDPVYQQIFTNDGVWQKLNEKYLQCSFVAGESNGRLLDRLNDQLIDQSPDLLVD